MVQYEKDFGDGSNTPDARRASGTSATAARTLDTFHDEEPEREGGIMGFLHRLFGAREEAIIGLLTLLFATTVSAIVLKDAYFAKFKDKSGVQRILAKKWNERTLVFPIEGWDRAGKRALFDVVVLTKNYGWVLGSTSELERDGTKLNARDIENEVLAPQLREGLGASRELIAVGVASQEGELDREIQRGGLRAARIAQWVRGAMGERMPMWTLNLGRYLDPCPDCEDAETSWQRPFVVIAVREAEEGINLSEALRSAMSDKENLPSPDRYSTFAMSKYVK
jgi:hypothetical protein